MHTSPIRPERIVADCQFVLPAHAIFACDVGINHNWFMQFWKARRPQTMLNSWGFSGMGFGVSAALSIWPKASGPIFQSQFRPTHATACCERAEKDGFSLRSLRSEQHSG
jgi:hypothetical protein